MLYTVSHARTKNHYVNILTLSYSRDKEQWIKSNDVVFKNPNGQIQSALKSSR